MARQSAAHKAETRQKILRRASQSFRAHGSGVGIADVMKELGMTHGGFYRHFDSKDDLFIEAVIASLAELSDRLEHLAEKAPKGKELRAIISWYFSLEHVLHPATGCTLAAMAPDIGRQAPPVRKRLDGAFRLYMERISQYLPGATARDRRDNFLVLFCGMAGAMMTIRAFGDSGIRDEALKVNREHYLKMFAAGTR